MNWLRPSLLLSLLTIALCCSSYSWAVSQKQSINSSWGFAYIGDALKDVPEKLDEIPLHELTWSRINIPHTWNKEAYFVKNYKRGFALYQKTLTIEPGKNTHLLKFEGINSSAHLFVNNNKVASHYGGYSSFATDISPYIKNGENKITLLVDNLNDNVPPLSGDFTIFGGIYRDAWLITKPNTHFDLTQLGANPIKIQTPEVSRKKATVKISALVKNNTESTQKAKLNISFFSPSGEIAYQTSKTFRLSPNSNKLTHDFRVTSPQLWSPTSPNLYQIVLTLNDSDGNVMDTQSANVGFRWFEINNQNQFVLNGEITKLRGVCRHQDQAPFGIALTNDFHRRDAQIIKDLGANFLRIAHYPQADELLAACDELGILVWEEIPVVDIISTDADFTQNAKSALSEMITQHYNHPSVIMWGYMNEAIIQVPHRIKDAEGRNNRYQATVDLAKELESQLHKEDPSRLSVMAYHGSSIYHEIGLSSISDISGWNLYNGWYGGNLASFNTTIADELKNHPTRPLIVSEYGAGGDKRIHSLKPEVFDFSIEYQQEFMEFYVNAIEENDAIMGSTVWNLIDFSSASRQESMPRINNKGILYNNRQPKDIFYLLQSTFRADTSILHIATDDWSNRAGVLPQGENVIYHPVKVYSNAQSVSLHANGKEAKLVSSKDNIFLFYVPLKGGTNKLQAKANNLHGEPISEEKAVQLTIIPEQLTDYENKRWSLSINAGSNCHFLAPESNNNWLPDRPYKEGSWGYTNGEVFRKNPGRIGTTAEVKQTPHDPLFQTQRSNPSYKFNLPNGRYEVTLGFADLSSFAKPSAYLLTSEQEEQSQNLDSRFDVWLNNELTLSDFSPAEEYGGHAAGYEKFIINITNNELTIILKSKTKNSFINNLTITSLN